MTEAEVLDTLERYGAVQRGHFRLTSGRHSDTFVQKFRVFERPRLAQSFGEAIAQLFAGEFDCVASPALGAVVLGFVTALAAEKRIIFAERVEGAMAFRRGFTVGPHERVLVVEDVLTTGGSAREVIDLVREAGGVVTGVGLLLDRTPNGHHLDLGAPARALARLDAPTWDAAECPLCAAGEAVSDPGGRRPAAGGPPASL